MNRSYFGDVLSAAAHNSAVSAHPFPSPLRRSCRNLGFAGAITGSLLLAACSENDRGNFESQKAVAAAAQLARNWPRAIESLKLAAGLDPGDSAVRWQLGQLYLNLDVPNEAEAHLRRAMELGVPPSVVLPLLAKALNLQGKYPEVVALQEPPGLSGDARALVAAEKALASLLAGHEKEAAEAMVLATAQGAGLPRVRVVQARMLIAQGDAATAAQLLDESLLNASGDAELWAMLGDLNRDAGAWKAADNAYTKAIAFSLVNNPVRYARARLRLDTGDLSGAEEDVKALEQTAPGSFAARLMRGRLALQQGRPQEALPALQAAMALNRFDFDAAFYAGLAAQATGNINQADDLLQRTVAQRPAFLPARFALARLRLDQGRFSESESLIRPVVDALPGNQLTLRALAAALIAQGKSAEAVKVLDKAATAPAAEPGTRFQMGVALMASGARERGEAVFDQLAALQPSYDAVYEFILRYYLAANDLAAVRRWTERFAAERPRGVGPLLWQARLAVAEGRPDAARETLESALARDPQGTAARYALAQLALAQGQETAAREQLKAIIDGKSDSLPALLTLAGLERQADRPREAVKWLAQAVADHPENPSALIALARFHLDVGAPRDAIALLRGRSDEHLHNDPGYLRTLGEAELRGGESQKAALTLRELTRVDPDSASTHSLYAQALIANDDRAGAQESLARALDLDPDLPGVRAEYAKLLFLDGQYDRAEQVLQPVRSTPDAEVLILTGMLAEHRGDTDEARARVTRAHALAPSSRSLLILARLAANAGRADEGIDLQTAWLAAHPEASEVRMSVAHDLVQCGRTPEAIEQYRAVLQRQPANILALNNLAWHLRESDPKGAVEFATRAVELAPKSDAAADTLAAVLSAVGRPDDALRAVELGLVRAPDSETLRLRKARLLLASARESDAVKILVPLAQSTSGSEEQAEATRVLDEFLSAKKGVDAGTAGGTRPRPP